ncbi:aminodeoxychorismate synthase component I [Dactylosporangium sp. NPDC050588]|uniref:aminodeoxychorismate synthase component I n=1 Tax=Dactylosporangium sp. NPDC050588 TaxID=3157211 RepID=UPI0033EB1F69
MTTLLIDNHDSFTYNLYQLLANFQGETLVVRNDDLAAWHRLDFDHIDRIVISPGPGRPDRAGDFGLSLIAVRDQLRPLLGVCLGHQGLCVVSGGRIVRAPEPMHGRASWIRHDGSELFEGLPSPFRAVRYHSLAAVDLPPAITCTARSDDDVVMAVRHERWPAWGVQFHPESISTEFGAELLANFLRLTGGDPRRRRPGGARRPVAQAQVGESSGQLRVSWQRLESVPDPAAAISALFGEQDVAFWIDTLGVDSEDNAYTYVGGSGGPHSETVEYDLGRASVTVSRPDGQRTEAATIFDYLNPRLAAHRLAVDAPAPLNLGYVGWFGYELKSLTTGAQRHTSPYPDAFFVLADRMLIIDHSASTAWLATLEDDMTAPEAAAWRRSASDRLDRLPEEPMPDLGAEPECGPDVVLRHDLATYSHMIAACQEHIRDGETYEVCLTNHLTIDADVDPLTLFRILRQTSPAPFSTFFRTKTLAIVGASPERFLTIHDGSVRSKPMKGTRRRGSTPDEDEHLREDLRTSVKDRAENLMITDLVRNDLGLIAKPGTVRVEDLYRVQTYEHVHQMISVVCADVADGRSAIGCVQATFPGGSMTGAPKERTMSIIDDLEGAARGIYSGASGFLSFDGGLDLSMVIRTFIVEPGRLTAGTGGAITALSDPQAEIDETLVKVRALLRAVRLTLDSETVAGRVSMPGGDLMG